MTTAGRPRIAEPRRSTLEVVSDSFFNVRTVILAVVCIYCCFKLSELNNRRNEVSRLLKKTGLQQYEEQFATKGYLSVDDVLLVSTQELIEDIGFESRIMANKVKMGARRMRRGDFLGNTIFYVVLVSVGMTAAMCILSSNFRRATAEIAILILLLSWSFGRKQYRQFYSENVAEIRPQPVVVEQEDDSELDRERRHKKIIRESKEKVKSIFSCCFTGGGQVDDTKED